MKIIRNLCLFVLLIGSVLVIGGLIITKGDFSEFGNMFQDNSNYEIVEQSGNEVINNVSVDVTVNNVIFLKSQDETYFVEYYESENVTFDFSVENGKLTIKSNHKRTSYFFNFNFLSRETYNVKIYLPDSFNGIIRCVSTTGNIIIDDYQIEDLNIVLTTGNIEISNTTIDNNLTFKTTTGRIILDRIVAERVIGSVTTGNTTIKNSDILYIIKVTGTTSSILLDQIETNQVELKTTTGRIRILNSISPDISANATTGTIEMNINGEKAGYKANLNTTTGSINFDGDKSRGSFSKQTGNFSIVAHTTTGNINIEFTP